MKVLLDTHAWIFAFLEPGRLSRRAREAIVDRANEVYLSPISVWETVLLGRRGRLRLEPDPVSWSRAALARSMAGMIPLTHEIALASHGLAAKLGRDPADRFLVATCVVHDLAIVTADRRIRRHGGVPAIW